MKQLLLENRFVTVNVEKASDKEVAILFWDNRGDIEEEVGFQTTLTKEDAKHIVRILDDWVSRGVV